MMNEESCFTLFNLYFITLPRQVFVKIFGEEIEVKTIYQLLRMMIRRYETKGIRPLS